MAPAGPLIAPPHLGDVGRGPIFSASQPLPQLASLPLAGLTSAPSLPLSLAATSADSLMWPAYLPPNYRLPLLQGSAGGGGGGSAAAAGLNSLSVDAMLAAATYEQRQRQAETSRLLTLLGHQRSLQMAPSGAGMLSTASMLSMIPLSHLSSGGTLFSSRADGPASIVPVNPSAAAAGVPSSTSAMLSQPPASSSSRPRIPATCETPEEATRVLKVLGSTLRTKGDPYVDASRITDPGASVSVRGGRTEYFTHKLHTMLDELEREGLAEICCWLPHGRAFQIRDTERFVAEVIPRYFNSLSQFSSFTRQLHLWGFGRMVSGPDAGCYYHELFLRGHPNLVGYMRRVGAPKGFDRRKVKSQESDEPFFGSMPPLP